MSSRAIARAPIAAAAAAAIAIAIASPVAASASPGADSIARPDGSSVYMVSPQGDGTVVTKLRGSDRTALVKRRLPGSFEVPAVAGVKGGLSSDGATLVLGGHPAAHVSRFAVLDARTLHVKRVLSLRGTYSFDAMSPDASTLYLIRFLSADGKHYAVQGLDMDDSHPVAKTLVEKGEPGEQMSGAALTRTSSSDGAWVYTLYDGAGEAPFVHALSTVDKFTLCIDLDALEGRKDLASLGLNLSPENHTLEVTASGGPVALIDTENFTATTPPTRHAAAPRPARDDPANVPWLPVGIVVLGLLAAAAVLRALRTGRSTRSRRRSPGGRLRPRTPDRTRSSN
jgi:hypothetical protein